MDYQTYIEYPLLIVISFLVAWLVSSALRKAFDFFILKNSSEMKVDPTNFIFIKNSIRFICYSIAIFWIFTKIPYFKNLGTALFASAGVLAAVIGFASQKAFSNIISGIFILAFKPFRIGDSIGVGNDYRGIVEEITMRHTVIKDYEFRRIVIPNRVISDETIINSSITDEKIRKHIDLSVGYDTDLEKAEKIIREIVSSHPFHIDNRTKKEKSDGKPDVEIRVIELGDSGITLRAFVWAKDFVSSRELHWDVLKSVLEEFRKSNIEIPYPHQSILMKGKE